MKRTLLGLLCVLAGSSMLLAGEHIDALAAKKEDLILVHVGSKEKGDSYENTMITNVRTCIEALEAVELTGGGFSEETWKNFLKHFAMASAYSSLVNGGGGAAMVFQEINRLQQVWVHIDFNELNAELVAEHFLPVVTATADYVENPLGGVTAEVVNQAMKAFRAWLKSLLAQEQVETEVLEEEEDEEESDEETGVKEEDGSDDAFFGALDEEDDMGGIDLSQLHLQELTLPANEEEEEEEEIDWGDDGDLFVPQGGDDDDSQTVPAPTTHVNATRVTVQHFNGGRATIFGSGSFESL